MKDVFDPHNFPSQKVGRKHPIKLAAANAGFDLENIKQKLGEIKDKAITGSASFEPSTNKRKTDGCRDRYWL